MNIPLFALLLISAIISTNGNQTREVEKKNPLLWIIMRQLDRIEMKQAMTSSGIHGGQKKPFMKNADKSVPNTLLQKQIDESKNQIEKILNKILTIGSRSDAQSNNIKGLQNELDKHVDYTKAEVKKLATTMATLKKQFDAQKVEFGRTIDNLQKEIQKKQGGQSTQHTPVALSSCGVHSPVPVSNDGIIKFPRKIMSVGVKQVSSYLSSGKFICKQAGLYHVSVTIMTSNSHVYYEVKKNGVQIVPGYIPDHSKQFSSGTINTMVDLNVNDQIAVYKGGVNKYYGYYSCFTIVKVN